MLCIVCAGNYIQGLSINTVIDEPGVFNIEVISETCRQVKAGFSTPLDLIRDDFLTLCGFPCV